MQYENTNRGAAWPNDKRGNEKAPDFTGNINIEGREYRISCWDNTEALVSNPKAPQFKYSVTAKAD